MVSLLWQSAAFIAIGSIAGLLGGLLGIGGGTVIVPCLYIVFKYAGLPQSSLMQMAVGTSLASIVFSTLSSSIAHNKRGAVDKNVLRRMIPGIILGCIIGSLLADSISSTLLEVFFGIFAITLSIYFLKAKHEVLDEGNLPSSPLLDISAFVIAVISSILGIGGGVMFVPYLHAHRFHEKKAIGTSSALSVCISLVAAISYLFFGLTDVSEFLCFGYIYLPAFICISISSYLIAPLGANLAHSLPSIILKRLFAFFMLCIGLLMIFKG